MGGAPKKIIKPIKKIVKPVEKVVKKVVKPIEKTFIEMRLFLHLFHLYKQIYINEKGRTVYRAANPDSYLRTKSVPQLLVVQLRSLRGDVVIPIPKRFV